MRNNDENVVSAIQWTSTLATSLSQFGLAAAIDTLAVIDDG
jgi:hypothetical protein